MTSKSVLRSCQEETIQEHRTLYPYSYYVLGKPSIWLAVGAIRLGLTANAVTVAGLAVLLAAFGALLWGAGRPVGYLAAGLLLNLALVLDAADGHVARFHSRCSRYGALLDMLAGLFQYSLLPLCLGLSLSLGPPEPWVARLPMAIPSAFWFVVGVVRSICCLQGLAIGLEAKMLASAGYHQRGYGQRWLQAARAINEGEAALLIIAALTSTVGLLHIGYAVFHFTAMVAAVGFNLKHLRSLDRE